MKKLLFAIFVAVLALVIARLGMVTGETVKLSLKIEEGKAYKVWISCTKKIEMTPEMGILLNKWDETAEFAFAVNPNPDDSIIPGKYRLGGMSGTGGRTWLPPPGPLGVDTTDARAVGLYLLEQLPKMAANNLSAMLFPWSLHRGFQELKVFSSLVAEPFEGGEMPDARDKSGREIPKYIRVSIFYPRYESRSRMLDGTLERIEQLYPEKRVAVGERWQVFLDSISGVPVNEKFNLTLKDRKGGRATLELEATADNRATPARLDTLGVVLSIAFSAMQTGTIEVDEKTGLMLDGNLEQVIEGKFVADSAAGLAAGDTTSFKLSASFKFECAEAPYSHLLDKGNVPPVKQPPDSLKKDRPAAADTANPGPTRRADRRNP
ncbi:MAG: DUF6263 family protein [Candidatus Glassbacteria bacterium]